ncbi:unnamed protein product [Aureobasidium vineae]|uniref:Uncharacterized protein n=1 Tax=Aureobasidium vineae TaxID=2773715 RepID=A0A9N8JQG4_9PEZI|nr:unnamed protein product [Aureobasidium vineae]
MTDNLPGKQWHENKKAFRPTAGQTSYAKRQAKDQALAVVKAQEKEMKEEKEAERQVRHCQRTCLEAATNIRTETHHGTQGEARGKGREGALRENGCQDAPEESRQTEAQREEKQASQVVEKLQVEDGEGVKRARHTSIERYPGCIFMAFLAWTGSGRGQQMHLPFYFSRNVPSAF